MSGAEKRRFADYDFILAADIHFHITEDTAFGTGLSPMTSWLKANGLPVVAAIFPARMACLAAHVKNWSLTQFQSGLAALGFKVIHVEPIDAILHPPTPLLDPDPLWATYAQLWLHPWLIAQLAPVDLVLPDMLSCLDEAFFLAKVGNLLPNTKWFLAGKPHASQPD